MAKIYTGIFSNTQVDYSDNSPNEQDVYVVITDQDNPHNIQYSLLSSGGGAQTYRFTFDSVPEGTCALAIAYSSDGGQTWNGQTAGAISPRDVTVVENIYIWRLYFQCTDYVWNSEAEEIDFDLAELPCVQRVVDNDEDKFTPIRSKTYEIQAHTSEDFSILNFKDGTDNQYKVEISVGSIDKVFFTGWLSVSDLRQRFQVDPNVLILTATDGLGFLKDVPLTDVDGERFSNENKIIEYIAGALVKTGLELPIVVEMNIYEVDAPVSAFGHTYNFCYLHALTFEDNINEFLDCYTVLEKILTENCTLTQEKNVWYIKRIDEVDSQDQLQVRFAYDGSNVETEVQENFVKELGSESNGSGGFTYDMGFMNEDAEVSITSAHKSVRHNFNYRMPQEIPCNTDFIRGDVIDDTDPLDITYEVECWEKLWSDTLTDEPQLTGIYIRRLFSDVGYENERYVVLEVNATRFTFIMSSEIPVEENDKFTISVDKRLDSDIGGSGFYRNACVQVRLYGDDGTFWTHRFPNSVNTSREWVQCTSTFRTNQKWAYFEGDASDDLTEWKSLYDGDVQPVPVDGKVRILLYRDDQFGDTNDTYYRNFNFTYIPFINGSYKQFSGQYHLSEQDTTDKLTRKKEVFISDAPKRIMKGCLLKASGDDFVKTDGFYNLAVFTSGSPSSEYIHPFGEIQNQDVWNQYNRTFVSFEGTVDGLDTDKTDSQDRPDIPGFMHRYKIRDKSELTNNKHFVLIHFEQDFNLCEWECFFTEAFDDTINKQYLGHSFKYIESDT